MTYCASAYGQWRLGKPYPAGDVLKCNNNCQKMSKDTAVTKSLDHMKPVGLSDQQQSPQWERMARLTDAEGKQSI